MYPNQLRLDSIRMHQPPFFRHITYTAFANQCRYLDDLANAEIPAQKISDDDLANINRFRVHLRNICRSVFFDAFDYLQGKGQIELQLIGSVASGLALKGSDMDLVLAPTFPRFHPAEELEQLRKLFEKKLLECDHGARLLSKTKVPLLKICQSPSAELLMRLRELSMIGSEEFTDEVIHLEQEAQNLPGKIDSNTSDAGSKASAGPDSTHGDETKSPASASAFSGSHLSSIQGDNRVAADVAGPKLENAARQHSVRKNQSRWTREKVPGPYDFPERGCGLRCDISFNQRVSSYNTRLVRLYTKCDPRVQPMILFVKIWAKRRKINSNYHCTLSSYGWTLLVLHFLINVATPPVLPNLQAGIPIPEFEAVDGHCASFFDDEQKLIQWAAAGILTQNFEPLGSLLRSFFMYYSRTGPYTQSGFDWQGSVVAIRKRGGLTTKVAKSWNKAKTVVDENGNQIRSNYLLAIECPVDLANNVARSVNNPGREAIRGEFHRACRILERVGSGRHVVGSLMDEYH
jgi:terminal uridylyltransferase